MPADATPMIFRHFLLLIFSPLLILLLFILLACLPCFSIAAIRCLMPMPLAASDDDFRFRRH